MESLNIHIDIFHSLAAPEFPEIAVKTSLSCVIEEACRLPPVPLSAAIQYCKKAPQMTRQVDTLLASRSDIMNLIGNNALQLMYDNHKHHAVFMTTVFNVGSYDLLARTVPWVYRSYHFHGFLHEYFIHELQAWKKAVTSSMNADRIEQILAVYDWMIACHDRMILLAAQPGTKLPISEQWLEIKENFKNRLLIGDHRGCLAIANQYVADQTDLQSLYLQIIQPAMYEIGMMWEEARISAAQEHLASAVVSRIMAGISMKVSLGTQTKGKAIVTSAVNELHEIGAWMISDMLEQDGWKVRYLGANTPEYDLLRMVDDYQPDLLAISMTMPFAITAIQKVIESIRANPVHKELKIMVGGRVFIDNPELRNYVDAHGFAANTDEALRLAGKWHSGR